MHSGSGRPLLLGVRWCGEPPARVVEYSESLLAVLEALEARGRHIPVHWNLAAQQLEKGGERLERLVERIAARIRSGGDRVLPAGYAGALHPLLSAEELEKELGWSRENPWGSGLRARFGQDPPFILPVYADLPRERTRQVYSRQGFRAIGLVLPSGVPGPSSVPFRLGLPSAVQAFACLPLPPAGTSRELRARLRGPLRDGGVEPLFLLLDYGAIARAGAGRGADAARIFAALQAWLGAPGGREAPVFLPLEEALGRTAGAAGGGAPGSLPEPPLPWDAATRSLLRRVRRVRRQPQEEEGIRRLLRTLAPGGEDWTAPPPPARPARSLRRTAGRTVTASMTGSAVLAGADFDAYFRAGQLMGLHGRGSPAADGLPWLPGEREVGSHLVTAGLRSPFQVDSCVSFESPSRTGLSAVLTATVAGTVEPFSLAVEYTFDDQGPGLRIDLSLHYPQALQDPAGPSGRFRPARSLLERVVPLEIPLTLLRAGEQVELEGCYPDGSGWRCLLPEEAAPAGAAGARCGQVFVLAGSRFTVHRRAPDGRPERLRLDIPSGGSRSAVEPNPRGEVHLVQLRLPPADREGRRALLVNPFGSYFPVAAARLAGQREELSIALRLEPDSGESLSSAASSPA